MSYGPADCPFGPEWFYITSRNKLGAWSQDLCLDCSKPLTPDNWAHYTTDEGTNPEPWEAPDAIEVVMRTAGIVELVCKPCWQKRAKWNPANPERTDE